MEEIERCIIKRGVHAHSVREKNQLQPLIPIFLRFLVREDGQALIEEPIEPFG